MPASWRSGDSGGNNASISGRSRIMTKRRSPAVVSRQNKPGANAIKKPCLARFFYGISAGGSEAVYQRDSELGVFIVAAQRHFIDVFDFVAQVHGQAAVQAALQAGFGTVNIVIGTHVSRKFFKEFYRLVDCPQVCQSQAADRFFLDFAGVIDFVTAITGAGYQIQEHGVRVDGAITKTKTGGDLIFKTTEAVAFLVASNGQVGCFTEITVKLHAG